MSFPEEIPIELSYGNGEDGEEDVVPIPEDSDEILLPSDELTLPPPSSSAPPSSSPRQNGVDVDPVQETEQTDNTTAPKATRTKAYKPPAPGTLFGRLAKVTSSPQPCLGIANLC